MQLVNHLHSQICNLRVSEAALGNRGSWPVSRALLVPARIMEAAGLFPREKVHVVNMSAGFRLAAYAADSGCDDAVITCGAVADLCKANDRLFVTAFLQARAWDGVPQWRFVRCKGKRNRIVESSGGPVWMLRDAAVPAETAESDPAGSEEEVFVRARELISAGFRLDDSMRGFVRAEYATADLRMHGRARELRQRLDDYVGTSEDVSGVLMEPDGSGPRGLWWELEDQAIDMSGVDGLRTKSWSASL